MNSFTSGMFEEFPEKFSYDSFEVIKTYGAKTYDAKHFLWLLSYYSNTNCKNYIIIYYKRLFQS